MIKNVLFDVGGTLERYWRDAESERKGAALILEAMDRIGIHIEGDLEEIRKEINEDRTAYRNYMINNHYVELSPEEIARQFVFARRDIDHEKLASIGEYISRVGEDYGMYREVRPDAEQMLKDLTERGYQLGVISNNSSRYQVFEGLTRYGLRKYFKDVTVSSIVGFHKPHPEIYKIALTQMDAAPEETLFVGDTVLPDVLGPKNVGIKYTAFVSRYSRDDVSKAQEAGADVIITDLCELVPWIDKYNNSVK